MVIWQTKVWGEMLIESSQAEKIIKLDGIFIEKRKVGIFGYGLFIIGFSGIIDEDLENKLIIICKKEKALFIQIEDLNYSGIQNKTLKIFKFGYYKKFITPYTAIIDISKTEDEILSQMKPKGKYNIKVAIKHGLEIKSVEKLDENIKIFFDLMQETTSRDKFKGNSFNYYKKFLQKIENSKLFLAYKGDLVIAGGIFVFEKDISIYYYGVSSAKYRNVMAPYLLQWEGIKYAKSVGSKIYDFLGIATPGEVESSLSGVTDFKLKLTPDIVNVSNSYIFTNKKFTYFLLIFLRKIKKYLKINKFS